MDINYYPYYADDKKIVGFVVNRRDITARKIEVTSLRLEQRVRFMTNLGTMREFGHQTEGQCEMVETHVIIDSPEPAERIQALLDEAESSCMAHHALRNPIPWSTRLVFNGEEIDSREG